MQDLERHGPPGSELRALEDRAESSFADLAFNLIAVVEGPTH
jgi:hypothetical protein